MSEKSVVVSETMDDTKDEDTNVAAACATNSVVTTDDDVPMPTVTNTNVDQTKMSVVENESCSTDNRKPGASADVVGVQMNNGNDSATDDDKLTAAMASTTISTSDESKPNDSSQNPDRQKQTQAPVAAAKESDAVVNVNLNESLKFETDEELNSTSQYEDAYEFIEDEEDDKKRPQNDDVVNHQDNVPDGESGNENEEEAGVNGDGEEVSDNFIFNLINFHLSSTNMQRRFDR